MFEEMNARVDEQVVEQVFKMHISEESLQRPAAPPAAAAAPAAAAPRAAAAPGSAIERQPGAARGRVAPATGKVGRNDPCTCGSGKKYKKCCGAV
jgi:uncharacterized protein YecA (UPF0149 family)